MLKYHVLSKEIQEKITEDRTKKRENPYKCKDFDALRRDTTHDNAICGALLLYVILRKYFICRCITDMPIKPRSFRCTITTISPEEDCMCSLSRALHAI